MQRTVLIADDASFMRSMLRGVLEESGYKVVGEADNGEKVVSLYKELKPDLVTMDITMPVKTGLEALKDIISLDPEAKIIMCSATSGNLNILESLKIGAIDFIVKPFQESQIREVLENIEFSDSSG